MELFSVEMLGCLPTALWINLKALRVPHETWPCLVWPNHFFSIRDHILPWSICKGVIKCPAVRAATEGCQQVQQEQGGAAPTSKESRASPSLCAREHRLNDSLSQQFQQFCVWSPITNFRISGRPPEELRSEHWAKEASFRELKKLAMNLRMWRYSTILYSVQYSRFIFATTAGMHHYLKVSDGVKLSRSWGAGWRA